MTTRTPGTRLLATKLYLPTARATAVTRPRLLARLLVCFHTRLTLITAPAGFGKSTLLAQVLAEACGAPGETGWIVLLFADIDGRQPAQPWHPDELERVLAALAELGAALTPSALPEALARTAGEAFAGHIRGWR